jgi:integrase
MAKKVPPRTQLPEVPPSPLADFIHKYRHSTGYVYRSGLLDFFDFINTKPIRAIVEKRDKDGNKFLHRMNATTEDMVRYESLAATYLSDKRRKHTEDLVRYAGHQHEIRTVPKTSHVRIVAVKEFFLRNGIELTKIEDRDVRRLQPKGGRRTDFEYIDRKTLSEILHHLDVRGKAFVLVLASSGMRIGEVLALNWADLRYPDRREYPHKPTSVFIRDSKTGFSRTTFITRECEQALKEWKKVYYVYRTFATKRSLNLQNAAKVKRNDDTKVFPFSTDSAYKMWNKALLGSGHFSQDAQTRRVRMNIHRLRNFFSVQVASVVGQQVSELLLGHTDNYGGAYTGRSPEELENAYLKAEQNLTIGAMGPMLEQYMEDRAKMKAENKEIKKILTLIEESQEEMSHLIGHKPGPLRTILEKQKLFPIRD